jgi:uncharacterized protein (DUF1499 family)
MAMPKPAVNPLEDLYQLISRGTIQKDVECRGKVWRFRSLFDDDYTWRDQFVNMSGPVSMSSSQRAPTVAVATVAIDGVPVESIEELTKVAENLPQAAQDLIRENPKYLIAYNLYEIISKLPRDHVVELYEKFLSEVEVPSRKVGADDIKNS